MIRIKPDEMKIIFKDKGHKKEMKFNGKKALANLLAYLISHYAVTIQCRDYINEIEIVINGQVIDNKFLSYKPQSGFISVHLDLEGAGIELDIEDACKRPRPKK